MAENLERAFRSFERSNRHLLGSTSAMIEGLRLQQPKLGNHLADSEQLLQAARRAAGSQNDAISHAISRIAPDFAMSGGLAAAARAAVLQAQRIEVLGWQPSDSFLRSLYDHPGLNAAVGAIAGTQLGAADEALMRIRKMMPHPSRHYSLDLDVLGELFRTVGADWAMLNEGSVERLSQVVEIAGSLAVEVVAAELQSQDAESKPEPDPSSDERLRYATDARNSQLNTWLAVFSIILTLVSMALDENQSERHIRAAVETALQPYVEHLEQLALTQPHVSDGHPTVAGDAPVRAEPLGKARALGRVRAGASLEVLGASGRWLYVAVSGNAEGVTFGWLFGRHVKWTYSDGSPADDD